MKPGDLVHVRSYGLHNFSSGLGMVVGKHVLVNVEGAPLECWRVLVPKLNQALLFLTEHLSIVQ